MVSLHPSGKGSVRELTYLGLRQTTLGLQSLFEAGSLPALEPVSLKLDPGELNDLGLASYRHKSLMRSQY